MYPMPSGVLVLLLVVLREYDLTFHRLPLPSIPQHELRTPLNVRHFWIDSSEAYADRKRVQTGAAPQQRRCCHCISVLC